MSPPGGSKGKAGHQQNHHDTGYEHDCDTEKLRQLRQNRILELKQVNPEAERVTLNYVG